MLLTQNTTSPCEYYLQYKEKVFIQLKTVLSIHCSNQNVLVNNRTIKERSSGKAKDRGREKKQREKKDREKKRQRERKKKIEKKKRERDDGMQCYAVPQRPENSSPLFENLLINYLSLLSEKFVSY